MERRMWLVLFFILIAAGASYFYFQPGARPPLPVPVEAPPAAAPPAALSAEPAIRHPIEPAPAQEAAPSLPALDDSDPEMRRALAALLGEPALALLYPERIIHRIVATVDNLPRRRAPAGAMPVKPAPGAFMVAGTGAALAISPANAARYAHYARLAQALDARRAVTLYIRLYPLFQRAYEELGYPKGYFNDRLIEAIDDLLDAPEGTGPVGLTQPKVLYQYGDPDLEMRSAGQKIMVRMGPANAAVIRARLREIRQELMRRSAK
jgi:Protein of unknown function (DUF3014)